MMVTRLLHRPLAVACLLYLTIVVVVGVFAPLVLPDIATHNAGELLDARQGPSGEHLLGTDSLGRDVLHRLLVGTTVTLTGVLQALVVVLALGVPFGLIAGYFGGWVDRIVAVLADLTFSLPTIVVVLVVLSVFPQDMAAAMIAFGVLTAPGLMRIVRSATLSVRSELYIAAAEVSGLSRPYIILRHVLPRVSGPILVQVSLIGASALLVQSGLGFLRLVVKAPAPSWGGMIADGMAAIFVQPWLIWPPGIAIALTILVMGLLGDAIRDAGAEAWSSSVRPTRRRRVAEVRVSEGVDSRDSLLRVEGLGVELRTTRPAVRLLDDISVSVRRGETVGLVGESGCGKTLTAKAILGLLPAGAVIDRGRVVFDGIDLASLSDADLHRVRGRRIALISQEPMVSLNPSLRVGWQLEEAVRLHRKISRRQAKAVVLELLETVRLPDPAGVARRYPFELSGGMAQRVAIARALAGEPELLIADEPTTALDVTVQAEILDLLRGLQRDRGMAILLVTHDWGVVADICDRAIVMYAGQVVEAAEIEPIFEAPRHPYTSALLDSTPHGATGQELLPMIPGSVPQPGTWPVGCHFADRCTFARSECRAAPIDLTVPEPDHVSRCIRIDALAEATR